MKKSIVLTPVSVCIILLALTAIRVSTEQYDQYLYYTVDNNSNVTIVNCDKSATKVVIPSEIDGKPVVSIGENAFCSCTNLTLVTIPDSITSIGRFAFSGCIRLTDIIIPNSVTSIGDSAFSSCTGLRDITISNNLTSIGEAAFSGCRLTSIKLPDSLTTIGAHAFYECDLTSVTIPDSVTYIGEKAFYNCSWLKNVTISSSVTTIPKSTFEGCSRLESITIPNSVTSIDKLAFYGCSNLQKIHITSIDAWCNIEFADITSNPLYYAKCLYRNNLVVRKAVISDAVSKIGAYTFYNCTHLTNITISDSVTSIGDSAFSGCTGLTSITIPNSVASVGRFAFSGCTGLTSVTISNGVTSIGERTFYGCGSLASITVPNSITNIDGWAFYGCNNLKDVYYTDSETEWNLISIGTYNEPLKKATIHFILKTLTETSKPITTANGKKFTTIPKNMPEDAYIILVCYKNKVLVNIQKAVNTNEAINFVVSQEFDEVKVMAWENLTSLKPIGKVENVNLS